MENRAFKHRGQAIFEYFILSIIVISLALFFLKSKNYNQIFNALNGTGGVFNNAVRNITE